MKARSSHVIEILVLANFSLFGQGMNMQPITMMSFSSRGGPEGVRGGQATFNVMPHPMVAPKNAPFSGQEVSENKQTLIDGTNITRENPRGPKVWRDSQGRVRTEEQRMGAMRDANGDPLFVEISDPVAGYVYVLDNVNHVAHRVALAGDADRPAVRRPVSSTASGGVPGGLIVSSTAPAGGGGGGGVAVGGVIGGIIGPVPASGGVNRPRPQTSTEDLGTRNFDGVIATGTRRTTIIPEGMQGNDRPMTTTSETWYSKEYGLTLMSINYSPLNGTSTTRIDNFSAVEPDPALFLIPSNFSTVDEKENFTIKWGQEK